MGPITRGPAPSDPAVAVETLPGLAGPRAAGAGVLANGPYNPGPSSAAQRPFLVWQGRGPSLPGRGRRTEPEPLADSARRTVIGSPCLGTSPRRGAGLGRAAAPPPQRAVDERLRPGARASRAMYVCLHACMCACMHACMHASGGCAVTRWCWQAQECARQHQLVENTGGVPMPVMSIRTGQRSVTPGSAVADEMIVTCRMAQPLRLV